MAGICELCGKTIGFKAFRCTDGKICKNCYEIVSNHFTDTITKATLTELKERYEENSRPLDLGEDGFQISYKVGTFLLLDEKNKKFCVLSNRAVTGNYARPEIFSYEALEGYEFIVSPGMTMEECLGLTSPRFQKQMIKDMRIRLKIRGTDGKDLVLLPGTVKVGGPAYRQACKYAREIRQCIERLQQC